MYSYFYDGSGHQPALWQTRSQMFKALVEKSPWLAAWDRLMRLLVRCGCGPLLAPSGLYAGRALWVCESVGARQGARGWWCGCWSGAAAGRGCCNHRGCGEAWPS